jgi:nucleoid-associated protein YgaU
VTTGWRLAGTSVACLLVVAALVVWRSTHLTGGWLLALQVTGALAVLGLVAAAGWSVLLATGRSAAEPARREVLLRVTEGQDGPATQVVPAPVADAGSLHGPALLGLAALVPVLLVLVLATPAGAVDVDGRAASAPLGPPTASEPAGTSPPPVPGTPAPSPTESPSQPATEPPSPPTPEPPGQPGACPVTVAGGDTLWDLAAAHLGPGADDAAIDAAWRADYAANRDVVGPDPDLILPGQVLALPCG